MKKKLHEHCLKKHKKRKIIEAKKKKGKYVEKKLK